MSRALKGKLVNAFHTATQKNNWMVGGMLCAILGIAYVGAASYLESTPPESSQQPLQVDPMKRDNELKNIDALMSKEREFLSKMTDATKAFTEFEKELTAAGEKKDYSTMLRSVNESAALRRTMILARQEEYNFSSTAFEQILSAQFVSEHDIESRLPQGAKLNANFRDECLGNKNYPTHLACVEEEDKKRISYMAGRGVAMMALKMISVGIIYFVALGFQDKVEAKAKKLKQVFDAETERLATLPPVRVEPIVKEVIEPQGTLQPIKVQQLVLKKPKVHNP